MCNSFEFFKGSILSRLKIESICFILLEFEEYEDFLGSLYFIVTFLISGSRMLIKIIFFLKLFIKVC